MSAKSELVEDLIQVALLMAQELQEYADVAAECHGGASPENATLDLIAEWDAAYQAYEAAP